MSELYGRNAIYYGSYFLFWVFTWPVAFPPDIGECARFRVARILEVTYVPETFLVFRFLTGFSSSAFLSVAAGSISDMFHPEEVAMYVLTDTTKDNSNLAVQPDGCVHLFAVLWPGARPRHIRFPCASEL